MKLIDNLTEKEYKEFFERSNYNHFLQSYAWSETCKVRNQVPVYFGLKDDNDNLVAAMSAEKKDLPFGLCYFYASRGPLIDFQNEEILTNFTTELKKYLKKHHAIYFAIDPAIMYQTIDDEAKPINGAPNNYELFNKLVNLGYVHKGFTKLFTLNQPRFTFRINTKNSLEDIEKNMNKTFLKTIKRSYNYDLEVLDYYDNETFFNLMKDIANKNNFNGNSKLFFQKFNENFTKDNMVHNISIKIYPDKILEKAQNELTNVKKDISDGKINEKHMADTNNIIARLEKDIETFTPYKGKYPDGMICLTLICPKTNKAMWTLYIGNNSLATYTFAVNRAYYEAIKYANKHNFEFLDLFGTVGDPHTTVNNYAGIHEYKRKMGGTYTEFMGQFDLVNNKLLYKLLPIPIKIYRFLKKKLKH